MSYNDKKAEVIFKTIESGKIKSEGTNMLEEMKNAGVTKIKLSQDSNEISLKGLTIEGLFNEVIKVAKANADTIKKGEGTVSLSNMSVFIEEKELKGYGINFKFNLN